MPTLSPHRDRNRKHLALLKDAGLRVTSQRLTILEVLDGATGHPDAQDLFVGAVRRDPSISLSTVYRTLKALEDSGAIHRHSFEGSASRFETADRDHHDHLIDLETGRVIEFRSEKIEQLQAEIAAELGYEIVDHRLELYGRKAK